MEFVKRWRFVVKFAGFFLFVSLMLLPAMGRAEQKGAEDSVRKMNTALMECMKKADQIGFRGRYKLLSPVIRDVFALPFMGEVSLGSYWKELTPEQRKQFMDAYTDWTISSYAGNFDGYSGEKFEVQKGRDDHGDKALVVCNLVRPHDDTIDFNYTLRRVKDKWRIVDIRISGVSQLALTRSQFVSVMKKKGFAGLISSLKEKTTALQNKELAKN